MKRGNEQYQTDKKWSTHGESIWGGREKEEKK